MKRMSIAVTTALALFATPVAAEETITLANYGGAWADTLSRVCGKPFEDATGVRVTQAATDDSAAQIRAQQLTGNVLWDISPTEGVTLPLAMKNDWLLPIDWSIVDPDNKLLEIARQPYAIGSVAYSTAIGYRTDKVPDGKTFDGWKDFWNVKDFPGPRTLRNSPVENLEFALIADGVPTADVYKVLSTPEGVDRAFQKLDEIKPYITVWWTSGQQPVQLLATGEVFYATAFNGRIAQLQKDNVPVKVMWKGASLDVSYYSIQKGAKNPRQAMEFMKFCWNTPERLVAIARTMPYSGFNPDIYDILSEEEAKELPTSTVNMAVQFQLNGAFWAEHRAGIQSRWEAWMLK